MYIFACGKCRKILSVVKVTSTKTYEKHLRVLKDKELYITTATSDGVEIYTCPECNDQTVLRVPLDEKNYDNLMSLLKEKDNKDMWEKLFDLLL